MKILFITTLDLQIKTFHERTIRLLKEQGNQVDAVTNGDYTTADIHKKYTVPFHRNPLHPDNLKACLFLRKLIKEQHYDVVSTHSPTGGFFGRLAARGLNTRVLYTAHGFHFWKGSPLLNQLVFRNMERLAAHWTDTLMTINPEDYEAAKTFHYKPGGGAVYIPGVGVDVHGIKALKTDRSEIRKELGLSEDAFVLYSIGELIPRKNHIFIVNALADAFHADPNLHYVIAGGGELKPLSDRIRELHLESQVHLLGFRTDARKLMYGMDLFVFPSFQEGLPVAVMEAMAAGLPVIATDIRGNHDLIEHGKNGFLYPVNDERAFLACLDQLRNDPSLREQFSKQEAEDAETYSIEQVQPQILALYRTNDSVENSARSE